MDPQDCGWGHTPWQADQLRLPAKCERLARIAADAEKRKRGADADEDEEEADDAGAPSAKKGKAEFVTADMSPESKAETRREILLTLRQDRYNGFFENLSHYRRSTHLKKVEKLINADKTQGRYADIEMEVKFAEANKSADESNNEELSDAQSAKYEALIKDKYVSLLARYRPDDFDNDGVKRMLELEARRSVAMEVIFPTEMQGTLYDWDRKGLEHLFYRVAQHVPFTSLIGYMNRETPTNTRVQINDWIISEDTKKLTNVEWVQNVIEIHRMSNDPIPTLQKKFVFLEYHFTPGREFHHPTMPWSGNCVQVSIIQVMDKDASMGGGHTPNSDSRGWGSLLLQKMQAWATERKCGIIIKNIMGDGWLQALQTGNAYGHPAGVSITGDKTVPRADCYVPMDLEGKDVMRVDVSLLDQVGATRIVREPNTTTIKFNNGAMRASADKVNLSVEMFVYSNGRVSRQMIPKRRAMLSGYFPRRYIHKDMSRPNATTGFKKNILTEIQKMGKSTVLFSFMDTNNDNMTEITSGEMVVNTPSKLGETKYIDNLPTVWIFRGEIPNDMRHENNIKEVMQVYHTVTRKFFDDLQIAKTTSREVDIFDAMVLRIATLPVTKKRDGKMRTNLHIVTLVPIDADYAIGKHDKDSAVQWASINLKRFGSGIRSDEEIVTLRILYRLEE